MDEINYIKNHYIGIDKQNKALQKELRITKKALELSIRDSFVNTREIEPTEKTLKSEVKDYLRMAAEDYAD
jgi:hypothetical protein